MESRSHQPRSPQRSRLRYYWGLLKGGFAVAVALAIALLALGFLRPVFLAFGGQPDGFGTLAGAVLVAILLAGGWYGRRYRRRR